MWPSAHIYPTHSIVAPSSTVVAILIIPDILQDSVPLPEWQQIHLFSCPSGKGASRLAQSRGQQTGSWPVAQQKQLSPPANTATQMQILALKRYYFSQGSSSASGWGERTSGTTDVSEVCTCQHLNQATSCTRNCKINYWTEASSDLLFLNMDNFRQRTPALQ